ncbi:replication protein A 70 kDa DNA-binding subunit A-like [Ananas comosus]|uniref:Replication protein A subunit n=1 Tax=Ananas comosus TaxID=4615 RepID=A0A199UWH9_ANACO|nr:replication protein A 70 kDa DNA-binding subunit A-like [Ananas comosus]OAY69163.1 Replication protein A 70 kDa DNA-binding subunit C [Ananas comosus]
MASSADLTRGAVAAISEGGAEGMRPVLQVWDLRLVNTAQSTTERYRMLLSDGVHMQQAMLATQMNGIVKSGSLQKGSIVQLNEYICNVIQGRRIIIIINLEVLRGESEMIGNPKTYDNNATSASQNRAPVSALPSTVDQPSKATINPQPFAGSHSSGPNAMGGGASVIPKPEPVMNNPSYGGSGMYGSGSMQGRNTANTNNTHAISGNQNQTFSNAGPGGQFRPPGSTYSRPALPTYQQPPSMYVNRGPIAKNEAPARIIPIAALNPYQGRWTIKARVTAKTELRRYNNPRGEGKVFSFDLLDSDGGEIRVTCFNTVADQFYDQIEAGRVYLISKGSLRPAQKTFNHLNNDYEIFLDSTSTVQPCVEEDNSIPKQQFNFRPVSEIESLESNSMVDVIGVVSSITPAATIMRKNGTETQKRTLQLKDMSGRSVEITLWGNFCNTEGQCMQTMCDSGVFPVLAVKAGRVSDFGGKSVGTISTSQLFIDPDFSEAQRLKEWYNREGKNTASLSISRDTSTMGRTDTRKTVSQIKDEGLGRSEKPDWITIKATVTFIKTDNFCYTACPLMVGDRHCNKKVNNNGDGTWHCDRCDQSFPECDYRYLLQFQIQDHTGTTWVTAFQEAGEELMGVPAKELYLVKYEEQDDVKFSDIIRNVSFNQYLFKLKVKEETFSEEQRVKSTVIKAEKINPSSESRYLLGLIEKFSNEDSNAASRIHGNPNFASGSGITMDVKPNIHPATNNVGVNIGMNQLGQTMNQYGGIMNHNIGARELCNNCGSPGHNSLNCPMSISRQGQSFGGNFANRPSNDSNTCFKCQQPGHWARDCPGVGAAGSAYGGGNVSGRYANQYVGGY